MCSCGNVCKRASLYICTARAHKSFVLLCRYICTVRALKGFVRGEPTRALYSVLVLALQGFVPTAYVLVRESANERAICAGESTRAFCFYVRPYGRAQKGFVRCKPTRALYSVLMLANQGFVPSAHVLVRVRVPVSSCTRTCTSLRYELTSFLCFCAGGCADVVMYKNLYGCTVRAHKGFM